MFLISYLCSIVSYEVIITFDSLSICVYVYIHVYYSVVSFTEITLSASL